MLRQISLSLLGLSLGAVLTIVGTVAYFADNATLNLVGFFYGLPLILGGLALKTTELKPVPYSTPTTDAVIALRTHQATVTQKKLQGDVTRFQYGQNTHLESALTYLRLGATKDQRPRLIGIREAETAGAYTLVLEFESAHLPLEGWLAKQEQMTAYFGPDIQVAIAQPTGDRIELSLIRVL